MKAKQAIRLLIGIALLALVVFLIAANRVGLTDAQVKRSASYTLDIRRMTGTDCHTMELSAGDKLDVAFETEAGSLHMAITAPNGTTLYAGNGKEINQFELRVPEAGLYTITVEAQHAEGKINIQPIGK